MWALPDRFGSSGEEDENDTMGLVTWAKVHNGRMANYVDDGFSFAYVFDA